MNNANEREIKRLLREVIDERIAANEQSDKQTEHATLLINGTNMFDESDRSDLEDTSVSVLEKLVDDNVNAVAANLAAQREDLKGRDPEEWPSPSAKAREKEIEERDSR